MLLYYCFFVYSIGNTNEDGNLGGSTENSSTRQTNGSSSGISNIQAYKTNVKDISSIKKPPTNKYFNAMRKFNRKLTCFKIALQNPKLFFLKDYVHEIGNEYDKAKCLGISNSEIRRLQKKIKETINFVSIFIKIKALFFEREELRKIDGIKSLKKSLSKFPNIIGYYNSHCYKQVYDEHFRVIIKNWDKVISLCEEIIRRKSFYLPVNTSLYKISNSKSDFENPLGKKLLSALKKFFLSLQGL